MVAVVLGALGIVFGALLFALGIMSNEGAGSHVIYLLGMGMIILSIILVSRGKGSYHA
jgi:hypothetical protein